mmetsp:Transcript_69318/g.122403  ORF Transcript_69318/g.122403 Transcript_69318/m.122403 type:complete len:80 (-) Transcript_69318:2368-2607(-)
MGERLKTIQNASHATHRTEQTHTHQRTCTQRPPMYTSVANAGSTHPALDHTADGPQAFALSISFWVNSPTSSLKAAKSA